MMICKGCGIDLEAAPDDAYITRHNGDKWCVLCEYRSLVSALHFQEFWLKHKVTSEHGIEINTAIVRDTRRKIRYVEDKVRKHYSRYKYGRIPERNIVPRKVSR